MSWMRFAAGCAIAVAGGFGLIACASSGPPVELVRVQWHASPAQPDAIEIRNRHGDLHLRQGSRGFVGIDAVGQCRQGSPRVADDTVGDRLRLVVEAGGCLRVDVAVFLPPGVPLSVETRDGRIAARTLVNPVSARSETGDISLTVAAPVAAHTASGVIRVNPTAIKWRQPIELSTSSGRIVFAAPEGEFRLRACTEGSIFSEIALQPLPDDDRRQCRAGRRGRGLYPILLNSGSGDVEIYRQ